MIKHVAEEIFERNGGWANFPVRRSIDRADECVPQIPRVPHENIARVQGVAIAEKFNDSERQGAEISVHERLNVPNCSDVTHEYFDCFVLRRGFEVDFLDAVEDFGEEFLNIARRSVSDFLVLEHPLVCFCVACAEHTCVRIAVVENYFV